MEHIHDLIIIDTVFRDGHAFVFTNLIHSALFTRTCMMSRLPYKGCRIEFYADECHVPAPTPSTGANQPVSIPVALPRKTSRHAIANRLDLLSLNRSNYGIGEENCTPSDQDDSDL